jgi:peptidyl-prolyl cis-trans isomerase B (cyclophilin B)
MKRRLSNGGFVKRQALYLIITLVLLSADVVSGRDYWSAKMVVKNSIENVLHSIGNRSEVTYLLEVQKIIGMKPMLDSMQAICPDQEFSSFEENLLKKCDEIYNDYGSHPYFSVLYGTLDQQCDAYQENLRDYIVPVTLIFQLAEKWLDQLNGPTMSHADSLRCRLIYGTLVPTPNARAAPIPGRDNPGGSTVAKTIPTIPIINPRFEGPSNPAEIAEKAGKAKDDSVAVMETKFGKIVLEFFLDVAPNHVANFKKLAESGFYDGCTFHRVIPGYMIQGGDPNSKDNDLTNDGMGGPGYTIPAEFNKKTHVRGTLSMARTSDPNSAGSQFFICVADCHQLDGQYTVFGQVIKGLDAAEKIANLPRNSSDNPGKDATMMKVSIIPRSQVK